MGHVELPQATSHMGCRLMPHDRQHQFHHQAASSLVASPNNVSQLTSRGIRHTRRCIEGCTVGGWQLERIASHWLETCIRQASHSSSMSSENLTVSVELLRIQVDPRMMRCAVCDKTVWQLKQIMTGCDRSQRLHRTRMTVIHLLI